MNRLISAGTALAFLIFGVRTSAEKNEMPPSENNTETEDNHRDQPEKEVHDFS